LDPLLKTTLTIAYLLLCQVMLHEEEEETEEEETEVAEEAAVKEEVGNEGLNRSLQRHEEVHM